MREEGKEEQKSEEKPGETAESFEETEGEEKEEEALEKVEETEEEALEPEEAAAPVEEEAKPPTKKEKEKEEEIVEERIYTIPLGKAWIMPPNKRAPRAMRIIRGFVTKHMKLETAGEEEEEETPKRLVINSDVNEKVWSRGIEKPPRKIRVRAAKDKEGNITVYLAEAD